jgi:hypothetical protein
MDRLQLLERCKRMPEARERFHELRQTVGTGMAARGVPMRRLQEWIGHRDYRRLKRVPLNKCGLSLSFRKGRMRSKAASRV